MKATHIALGLLLAVGAAPAQYRRGVNISGAEFGNQHLPGVSGTDYWFNSDNTFSYFAGKKLTLMRIPLQWERLQPTLDSPLDNAYLTKVKGDVAWAKSHGGDVILDIHNFGRYSFNESGGLHAYIIDNPIAGVVKVSAADLADLWIRLSNEFKFETAVYAYDLMNEPHDMAGGSWKTISQTVLTAIRAQQDDKLVLIPGDSWSSANRWVTTHGPTAWIQDPANNFAYEAHQYFDSDESGTYKSSYDVELAANPNLATVGATRVSHFLTWCQQNQVRGIVDEYGIPYNDSRWATVLGNFFTVLDAAGMDGAYWAAGEWWPVTDLLSVQPAANFTQDRPQMATLLAHVPGGYLTALSAASISVARAAPGSLVSIYGSGFTDQTAVGAPPWPLALGNVSVQVTDAAGSSAPAGLVYVSPGQLNIQIPGQLQGSGRPTISVMRGGTQVASGSVAMAVPAPAVFSANSAGYGVAAAQIVRVKPDGTLVFEGVSAPIDFGAATDRVFLALYGTGIRAANATVRVGSTDISAAYAGPQGQYPGLDQVNVELSRSLAGSGQVNVTLTCGGVAANSVTIAFQ